MTETRVNDDEWDVINIPGYNLVNSFCRPATNHGGGVSIHVAETLADIKQISVDNICEQSVFECCVVEVVEIKVIVVVLYRAPKADSQIFFDKLQLLCSKLFTLNRRIIICGNLNINTLVDNKETSQLLNIMLMFNLIDLITSPTRITNRTATCIDHIITNISPEESKCEIIDTGLSDHTAQLMSFHTKKKSQDSKGLNVRKYCMKNIEKFEYTLNNIDWSPVYNEEKVDIMFNTFYDIFSCTFVSF